MDFAAFLSNLGNNLGFGLIVTLIGMLTVFFGLVLLIGLIKLMENATANLGKSGKKAKKQAEAPAPAPVAAPVVEEVPVADDSELIAVISAAVAMMMEDGSAFTVRRVRRVQNAPAWQKAGREEQVYSRFYILFPAFTCAICLRLFLSGVRSFHLA